MRAVNISPEGMQPYVSTKGKDLVVGCSFWQQRRRGKKASMMPHGGVLGIRFLALADSWLLTHDEAAER